MPAPPFDTAIAALAGVRDGACLTRVRKEHRSAELLRVAISVKGKQLKHVALRDRNPALCLLAVQQDGEALEYVPVASRTPAMCLAAVRQHGTAVQWVPAALQTHALCLTAINNAGYAIQYLPIAMQRDPMMVISAARQQDFYNDVIEAILPEMRTSDVYLAAVQADPRSIERVPKDAQTLEICEVATQSDSLLICYCAFQTEEMALRAIRDNVERKHHGSIFNDGVKYDALLFVHIIVRTTRVYLAALNARCGCNMCDVPEVEQTPEFCMEAVRISGHNLSGVKPEVLSPELCEVAVRNAGRSLEHVPIDFRTEHLCDLAVRQDPYAIAYVPAELVTAELVSFVSHAVQRGLPLLKWREDLQLTAVTICGFHIDCLTNRFDFRPSDSLSMRVLLAAVRQNGLALRFISSATQTLDSELQLLAVQQNGLALEFVDRHPISRERTLPYDVCLAAVRQNGLALQYVSLSAQTLELQLLAVQQNGLALLYVGRRHISSEQTLPYDVCLAAVRQNGLALQYVCSSAQTLELQLLAVQQNGLALEFVDRYPISREQTLPYDVCVAAVRQNGLALRSVRSIDSQTPELQLLAVQQNGLAVQYVIGEPSRFCQISALRQNGLALQYIFRASAPQLFSAAVRQNGAALQFVPLHMRTIALCKQALNSGGGAAYSFLPGALHNALVLWLLEF